MTYKISDISEDVCSRFGKVFSNHLFLIFFGFFIITVGSSGIWFSPLFLTKPFSFEGVVDAFNTFSLLMISIPLLSATLFDLVLRVAAKYGSDRDSVQIDLIVWYSLITCIFVFIVGVLFLLGRSDEPGFSKLSIVAWVMVLFYWALANSTNDAYSKPLISSAAVGTNDVNQLPDGER